MIILGYFFLFLHENVWIYNKNSASNEYSQHMFYGELEKIIPELS